MTHGHVFDLNFGWIARINSAGIAVGSLDPDSLGVGPTVSPAYLLKGLVKLTTSKPSHASVEWHGSGAPEGKRQVGLDSIGDATLEVTQIDNATNSILNNGLVDTTSLTGMEIYAPNNLNPAPNTVVFCAISKINIPGTNVVKYHHIFYPACTISKSQPDAQQVEGTQKNPNNITLTISPTVAGTFPNGVAFGVNQGWYGYQEFEWQGDSLYPYMMDTWVADGTATTFNLSGLPKYSTVTAGKLNNWVAKNGTVTAPTSISTSTKAVVIPAAGTVADLWNVMYPMDAAVMKALAA